MRKLGALGIVLVGLYLIAQAIPTIARALETGAAGDFSVTVFAGAVVVLCVGLGSALILGRNRLADSWFDETELGVDIEPRELLRIGVALFGVWELVTGLFAVLISVTGMISTAAALRANDFDAGFTAQQWTASLSSVALALLRLFIGWLLIYYSCRLANYIWDLAPKTPRPEAVNAPQAAEPVMLHCPSCGHPYDPAEYRQGADSLCSECHEPLHPKCD